MVAFLSALVIYGARFTLSIFFFIGACLFHVFREIGGGPLENWYYSREWVRSPRTKYVAFYQGSEM